jgi:integrase
MPTPTLTVRDGVYYAIWSDNRRSKRKSMGTSDRAAAEQRFAQWLLLGGHREGGTTPTGQNALTVAELWTVYEARHVRTEIVATATVDYSWRNLKPHFGDMRVDQIDQTAVDDYEDKRVEGAIGKPSVAGTVRRELAVLRAMLNWHASPERGKKRMLERGDLPSFTLPDESEPRDKWLKGPQIEKLMAAAEPVDGDRMSRACRFLWLALETAARKQAILDLTWDRVDFESGMIHYAVPGRKATKKRRPSVPISARLLPVLERMKAEARSECVLDHPGEVWSAIQAVVIRAGLAKKQKRASGSCIKSTGISPHTLRHTAATQMARRGVPLYDIAGVLGNSLAMIERVYAKHCSGKLRDAVNAISGEGVRS